MKLRVSSLISLAVVAALTAAACGGGSSGGGGGGGGGDGADDSGIIRFTFAPDPVWDWLKDEGILEEMEADSGFRILQLATWDEFATFAGGHADVISTGSYETPVFEQQGIKTVTFAKFNMNKDVLITANEDYNTASDFPEGCKIASESTTGNTIIWASLIEAIDGRELAENSPDLGIVTADYQIIPTLVREGEACAGIVDPTQVIGAMASGDLKVMYDGKSASQLYGEEIVPGHEGVNSNNFVARKEWFDSHQEEAAFFLEVWERGMQEWEQNRDKIIDAYPQHFAVENKRESDFIKNYFENTFDWFVDTPYLDEEWIEGERGVYELVVDAGIVREDVPFPEHAIIDPETGEVTERIGG
jgi:hypothetical protein